MWLFHELVICYTCDMRRDYGMDRYMCIHVICDMAETGTVQCDTCIMRYGFDISLCM